MTGMPERRRDEMFYLPDDPGQERNLLARNPEKARELHGALLDLITQTATDPEIASTYKPLPS